MVSQSITRIRAKWLIASFLAVSMQFEILLAVNAASNVPPSITITIDDTVVSQLLKMIALHDDTPEDIDAWVNLPGNRELIKVGQEEGEMSVTQLKANVKAVIDGTANNQNQPLSTFGRVYIPSTQDYSSMLLELHKYAGDWLNLCALRDASFAPSGVNVKQTVYIHLGGDWDAINKDGSIYINMAYFHDNFHPSWSGLNLLISHETFHAVQNEAFGNPETSDTSDEAFITALSKIQREGTARMVEVDADPDGYTQGTYGFYFRAIDNESIREFPSTLPLLSTLTMACYPKLDADSFQAEVNRGLDSGGTYYTLGEGIALAIDRYAGRQRFIQTVTKGPLDFFDCYAGLCKSHADLPRIPDDALIQIERLKSQGYVVKGVPAAN
jgi:hypothetical protein